MANELKRRKLILRNFQSPGDLMMLTATVRDLHKNYPGRFMTDVRTSCSALWENNPYLTELDEKDPDVEVIDCEYPLIHKSNTAPYHFIHGFTQFLEEKLDLRIPMTEFKGDIHLSDDEKKWMGQVEEIGVKDDYWLIAAGCKYDFNAKLWNFDSYQEVVDHFLGKITFVQVGEEGHLHCRLNNVIDLVGKTDLRQLIRLVHHSIGTFSPVTLLMHLCASVPVKEGRPKSRAGLVLSAGREPQNWENYPHHRFLSTTGVLSCCDLGGCWKSRVTKIKDNDDKNNEENLCIFPVTIFPKAEYPEDMIDGDLKIAKCMDMIRPSDVIRNIELYYEGDMLRYQSSLPDFLSAKTREYVRLHVK